MATSLPRSITPSSPPQAAPAPDLRGAHVVQLYNDDEALLDMLCRFIGGALAIGDASVVIATQAHYEGLIPRMKTRLEIDSMPRGTTVTAEIPAREFSSSREKLT